MADNTDDTMKVWPDDYSEDELIDDAAYEVMEGVNEGDHSWADEERLRRFAEYAIGGIPLDESHIDTIVERAKDQYAPSETDSNQSILDY